jgi:hypothetical protein
MLGRRSDERFKFIKPAAGAVHVFYDVIVKWNAENEWIAIGREPAVAGETLVLQVDDGEQRNQFMVNVIESSPVIVGGDMRHRIRLQDAEQLQLPVLFEQQVRRG